MHTFQDASLRPWDFVLNINAARRVWQRLQINLRAPQDLAKLEGDESTFVLTQLLAVVCEDVATTVWPECERSTTQSKHDYLCDRFGDLLDDARVERAALTAVCDELADFCQRRGLPAKVGPMARTIPERMDAWMDRRLKALGTPAEELAKIRGETVPPPPEKSGTCPTGTLPSVSCTTPSTPTAEPSGGE